MAHEIRQNLYVDNLIYVTLTSNDAPVKYKQSKDNFEGLSKNFREFISNDEAFNNFLPEKDRSASFRPKVLGIYWKTKTDTIALNGTMTTKGDYRAHGFATSSVDI